MVDRDNIDAPILFADAIEHPEVTATRAVESGEFQPQWFSDALGILCERPVTEFDHCGCDLFREPRK